MGVVHANLWAGSSDSHPPQAELSLPEYVSVLDQSSAILAGKDPAVIHRFRTALPPRWIVRAEGRTLEVNTEWLAAALALAQTHPGTNDLLVKQAEQRLVLLREAAEGYVRSDLTRHRLTQSRDQLDRILSDAEFRGARGPSGFDLLKERVYSWIAAALGRVFGRAARSPAASAAVAWTLIALVVLLLAYWAVRTVIGPRTQSAMDLKGAVPQGLDWRECFRDARAAAARGDYRSAVHAAYWAGIKRLESTHRLSDAGSMTPRESLQMVKDDGAAYAPLSRLTHYFELIWYGNRPATAADWADAVRQLEALGCLSPSTPATAGS